MSSGVLSASWEKAFAAVGRDGFVPGRVWPYRDGVGYGQVVDRGRDPGAWSAVVAEDIALVTQWDDGAHVGDGPGELASSSASAPTAVAVELAALELADGMRVLEIGTGTGWTAALLAARGARVTTVEIDPAIAARARDAIGRAGYGESVTVVAGDGTLGHPPSAPFDRVHVTAGVRRVPAAWIEQTVPGGVLVMPWGTDYSPDDQAVRLTVAAGNRAIGAFLGGLSFMKLRSQRAEFPDAHWPGTWKRTARTSTPALTIAEVTYPAVEFILGLLVPNCMPDIWDAERMYLYGWEGSGRDSGNGEHSLAEVLFPAGGDTPVVHQAGPRDLWTEVETAHARWSAAGRPAADRFGLTVTVRGGDTVEERVWYESPDRELPA
ncbi:methyltransferase domain-containing protein [Embleya sp. AB8]|uniref:methyltransferase domain-containing protein n=1 Tax=Embleya sp. AB8 TaxID=3156304 RepID=UPI003C780989